MQLDQDTIAAIATAPGRGGIGIVRLSGPLARQLAGGLFRLRQPLAHGRARFGLLVDEQGSTLDEGIVTLFAAPTSYTGEDVVEMAVHGAPVLLEHLLHTVIAAGARLAEPGEFTQRAFLNGRLDLTQAEAVADLVNAQTLTQARVAAAQLGGSIAHAVAPVKRQLIALIAELEAGVDFAEDDLDLESDPGLAVRCAAVEQVLDGLAATYRHGRILHEGFRLAIVGRPNAGKSSLFNRLLQRERAIVTATPGTTRDPISEHLAIQGIPVELIDTAGLRELAGEPAAAIEAEGIRRSHIAIAESDIILLVIDAGSLGPAASLQPGDEAILALIGSRPHLVAVNKSDLADVGTDLPAKAVAVSALTGQGIAELADAIVSTVNGGAAHTDSALVTSLRQRRAVDDALNAARSAAASAHKRVPHEFILLDLYACLEALDGLTGATTSDDILKLIFSSFCIGK